MKFVHSIAVYTIVCISYGQARIRPNDDQLTVFPDACNVDGDDDDDAQGRASGNCGVQRLDQVGHSWLLRSDDGVYADIPSTVPGDILTDLQDAGIIMDPYYNNNFLDQRHVWMGEDRVKANGTSCYSSQRRRRLKDEYMIPNLEVRSRTWIYETHFRLDNQNQVLQSVSSKRRGAEWTNEGAHFQRQRNYALVVEGIKMGASVSINGIPSGNVTDQFLRYIFPLSQSMLRSNLTNLNSLSIAFDPEIDTHGRFMACSGGWDWAPYSMAAEKSCSSRRVLSFGIFKPIYVVEMNDVAVVNVVPKIRYKGDPTIEYLKDGKDFELVVEVHLLCQGGNIDAVENSETAEVLIRASFMPDVVIRVKHAHRRREVTNSSAPILIVSLTKQISQDAISLWWPHGIGNQTLYTIRVAYQDKSSATLTSWVRQKVGFRSVALITHNEDQGVPDEEGTGVHGFYFKINGFAIYARGANVVPTSQLEGRLTDEGHRILIDSAVAANMNMLRVWGGGMIMPNSFYDACDEKGILLFHDLMFVQEQYHGLENRIEVGNEIRYIVRQLCSHPSIVIWNGCNECDHTNITSDLYSEFALPIVSKTDGTRPIWSSSPSNGWKSGVYGRDQLPNGKILKFKADANANVPSIETHGPYNHGVSKQFATVNGHLDNKRNLYDTKIPLFIRRHDIGLRYENQFTSEFGASSFPSFESFHPTLSVDSWGLHGNAGMPSNCSQIYENLNECSGPNVISQRNYPCDSHIRAYFGDVDLFTTGRKSFQKQLLQCMISQMLWMKGEIEQLRSTNSFGSLIWQLNENWPTGGWGLLEYGSRPHEEGQVMGGRWKPLMHLLQRSLFRDVFATCGVAIDGFNYGTRRCFIRNDGVRIVTAKLIIELWEFRGKTHSIFSKEFTLNPNGDTEYFEVKIDEASLNSSVLAITVLDGDSHNILMGQNIVLWKVPKDLHWLARDPKISVLSIRPVNNGAMEIVIRTEDTALYVGLTTTVQGRFEDNWFSMKARTTKSVKFIPLAFDSEAPFNASSFSDSLRIEHLGMALGLNLWSHYVE